MIQRWIIQRLSLKWYEGVFIGAALLLGVFSYLQYQRLSATTTELAITQGALEGAAQVQEVTHERQKINDDLVRWVVEEFQINRPEQRLQRQVIIDDYLTLVGRPSPIRADSEVHDPPPEPEDVPHDPTGSTLASRSPPPPPVHDDPVRVRERLESLAHGMHGIYCTATTAPEADCTP